MSLIFDKISTSFSEELPFVCFRKPNQSRVKGYFCKTSELVYTKNYLEQGFVFAPFKEENPSIIFLKSNSEVFEEDVEKEVVKKSSAIVETIYSDEKKHLLLVEKGIEEITKGELEKVVLSRKEKALISEFELEDTFRRLLSTYSNAFVYVWCHPKIGLWMGATPERLLTLNNNEFTTMALAGTQTYRGNLNPVWGEKEKKEHQYVVDYIVSQLQDPQNGVALKKLEVSEIHTIKAGNLLHLRADIKGKIGDFELGKLLKTLHPTPAVCGLPKEEARQFVLKNEDYNRLYYSGFLGEININLVTELFVNLRCVEFIDRVANIYVGGGITIDSNPEKEWLETNAKAVTIKNIL